MLTWHENLRRWIDRCVRCVYFRSRRDTELLSSRGYSCRKINYSCAYYQELLLRLRFSNKRIRQLTIECWMWTVSKKPFNGVANISRRDIFQRVEVANVICVNGMFWSSTSINSYELQKKVQFQQIIIWKRNKKEFNSYQTNGKVAFRYHGYHCVDCFFYLSEIRSFRTARTWEPARVFTQRIKALFLTI